MWQFAGSQYPTEGGTARREVVSGRPDVDDRVRSTSTSTEYLHTAMLPAYMRREVLLSILLLIFATAADTGVSTLLVKSICVDSADRPVAVDPYPTCPNGTNSRKIDVGDPLPYHNVDQGGYMQVFCFSSSSPPPLPATLRHDYLLSHRRCVFSP